MFPMLMNSNYVLTYCRLGQFDDDTLNPIAHGPDMIHIKVSLIGYKYRNAVKTHYYQGSSCVFHALQF